MVHVQVFFQILNKWEAAILGRRLDIWVDLVDTIGQLSQTFGWKQDSLVLMNKDFFEVICCDIKSFVFKVCVLTIIATRALVGKDSAQKRHRSCHLSYFPPLHDQKETLPSLSPCVDHTHE